MKASGRRLILHLGIGKTGSSALQVGLVRNRKRLRELNVDYPVHLSDADASLGRVTSGNGMALRSWLCARDPDAQEASLDLVGVVRRVSESPCETVLYSSEFLIQYRPDRLRALFDELAALGVALQTVVYVRNISGHAISSYSQVVKRGLFTGDLKSFVEDRSASGYRSHLGKILPLIRILGRENVEVVHYDDVRDRLFLDFVERVLALESRDGLSQPPEMINRSLTHREIQLMRRVNSRLTRRAHARRVSDLLLGQPPLGEEGPIISSDDLNYLRDLFEDPLAKVREEFLASSTFGVLSDEVSVVETLAPEPAWTEREEAMLTLVAGLCGRRKLPISTP